MFRNVLYVLLVLAFIALCAVTVISLAPFGAVAILAFRAGWIGTGLLVFGSIVFHVWLLFWLVGLLRVQPAERTP